MRHKFIRPISGVLGFWGFGSVLSLARPSGARQLVIGEGIFTLFWRLEEVLLQFRVLKACVEHG